MIHRQLVMTIHHADLWCGTTKVHSSHLLQLFKHAVNLRATKKQVIPPSTSNDYSSR